MFTRLDDCIVGVLDKLNNYPFIQSATMYDLRTSFLSTNCINPLLYHFLNPGGPLSSSFVSHLAVPALRVRKSQCYAASATLAALIVSMSQLGYVLPAILHPW